MRHRTAGASLHAEGFGDAGVAGSSAVTAGVGVFAAGTGVAASPVASGVAVPPTALAAALAAARGAPAGGTAAAWPASGAVPFPEPFINATPRLRGCAAARLAACAPLAVVRVAVFVLAACAALVWMTLLTAGCGLSMARGREARLFLALSAPIRWACAVGLACFGVWRVEEEFLAAGGGREDARARAARDVCGVPRALRAADAPPVVVANHTSALDALYIGRCVLPVVVGKSGIMRVPVIGGIFASMAPILVPRSAAERAALPAVTDAIVARARAGLPGGPPGPRSQPLIVFPEGTTVNGAHVIAFQRGAFAPGVAVQPLAIDYPGDGLDVSLPPHLPNWVVLGRMLCTPHTRMRVRYLPVYEPTPAERADPQLFADNVRAAICAVLGATPAPHTDRDALVLQAALAADADFAPYASRALLPRALSVDIVAALRLPPRTPAAALVALLRTVATYDSAGDGRLRAGDVDAWAAERLLPAAHRMPVAPLRRRADPPRRASTACAAVPPPPPGYSAALFAALLTAAAPYDPPEIAAAPAAAPSLSLAGVVAVLAVARFGRVAAAADAPPPPRPAAADADADAAVTAEQLALAVAVLSLTTALATADLRVVGAVLDGGSGGGSRAAAMPQPQPPPPPAALTGTALEDMRRRAWDASGAVVDRELRSRVRRVVLAASALLAESWSVDNWA